MPGPVPGIHVLATRKKVVDGRDKPGHDGENDSLYCRATTRAAKPAFAA